MKTKYPEHLHKKLAHIESLPRPQRWVEARHFLLTARPDLRQLDKGFIEAVREIREADSTNLTGRTDGGHMRNTMKIPQYIYDVLVTLDPQLTYDQSGKDGEHAKTIYKQLYNAFPMYRVARVY